jgi:FMN phosphatase YigB (HAD superfamily)
MKALLFDLDDTLLENSMDRFIPAYFDALRSWCADLIPGDTLIQELLRATQAMVANDGSGQTNEEVFAGLFYPALGFERSELEPHFKRFYAEAFPLLQSFTSRKPEARPLVEWAFDRGLTVVIATNPLFPATAIEQRLSWAGVGVEDFSYALVTTYENMHATKADPAYFSEILEAIGHAPEECLMVGDNWGWDIAQPAQVGIPAFWITDGDGVPEGEGIEPVGTGTLADFEIWVRELC